MARPKIDDLSLPEREALRRLALAGTRGCAPDDDEAEPYRMLSGRGLAGIAFETGDGRYKATVAGLQCASELPRELTEGERALKQEWEVEFLRGAKHVREHYVRLYGTWGAVAARVRKLKAELAKKDSGVRFWVGGEEV